MKSEKTFRSTAEKFLQSDATIVQLLNSFNELVSEAKVKCNESNETRTPVVTVILDCIRKNLFCIIAYAEGGTAQARSSTLQKLCTRISTVVNELKLKNEYIKDLTVTTFEFLFGQPSWIAKEILRMYNAIIQVSDKAVRMEIFKDKGPYYFGRLIDELPFGDFDYQLIILETLFRNCSTESLKDMLKVDFMTEKIREALHLVNINEFDLTARIFLNQLNAIETHVISILCNKITFDDHELKQPDELLFYEGIWADLNVKASTITLFINNSLFYNDCQWEMITIFADNVNQIKTFFDSNEKNKEEEGIAEINLKGPCQLCYSSPKHVLKSCRTIRFHSLDKKRFKKIFVQLFPQIISTAKQKPKKTLTLKKVYRPLDIASVKSHSTMNLTLDSRRAGRKHKDGKRKKTVSFADSIDSSSLKTTTSCRSIGNLSHLDADVLRDTSLRNKSTTFKRFSSALVQLESAKQKYSIDTAKNKLSDLLKTDKNVLSQQDSVSKDSRFQYSSKFTSKLLDIDDDIIPEAQYKNHLNLKKGTNVGTLSSCLINVEPNKSHTQKLSSTIVKRANVGTLKGNFLDIEHDSKSEFLSADEKSTASDSFHTIENIDNKENLVKGSQSKTSEIPKTDNKTIIKKRNLPEKLSEIPAKDSRKPKKEITKILKPKQEKIIGNNTDKNKTIASCLGTQLSEDLFVTPTEDEDKKNITIPMRDISKFKPKNIGDKNFFKSLSLKNSSFTKDRLRDCQPDKFDMLKLERPIYSAIETPKEDISLEPDLIEWPKVKSQNKFNTETQLFDTALTHFEGETPDIPTTLELFQDISQDNMLNDSSSKSNSEETNFNSNEGLKNKIIILSDIKIGSMKKKSSSFNQDLVSNSQGKENLKPKNESNILSIKSSENLIKDTNLELSFEYNSLNTQKIANLLKSDEDDDLEIEGEIKKMQNDCHEFYTQKESQVGSETIDIDLQDIRKSPSFAEDDENFENRVTTKKHIEQKIHIGYHKLSREKESQELGCEKESYTQKKPQEDFDEVIKIDKTSITKSPSVENVNLETQVKMKKSRKRKGKTVINKLSTQKESVDSPKTDKQDITKIRSFSTENENLRTKIETKKSRKQKIQIDHHESTMKEAQELNSKNKSCTQEKQKLDCENDLYTQKESQELDDNNLDTQKESQICSVESITIDEQYIRKNRSAKKNANLKTQEKKKMTRKRKAKFVTDKLFTQKKSQVGSVDSAETDKQDITKIQSFSTENENLGTKIETNESRKQKIQIDHHESTIKEAQELNNDLYTQKESQELDDNNLDTQKESQICSVESITIDEQDIKKNRSAKKNPNLKTQEKKKMTRKRKAKFVTDKLFTQKKSQVGSVDSAETEKQDDREIPSTEKVKLEPEVENKQSKKRKIQNDLHENESQELGSENKSCTQKESQELDTENTQKVSQVGFTESIRIVEEDMEEILPTFEIENTDLQTQVTTKKTINQKQSKLDSIETDKKGNAKIPSFATENDNLETQVKTKKSKKRKMQINDDDLSTQQESQYLGSGNQLYTQVETQIGSVESIRIDKKEIEKGILFASEKEILEIQTELKKAKKRKIQNDQHKLRAQNESKVDSIKTAKQDVAQVPSSTKENDNLKNQVEQKEPKTQKMQIADQTSEKTASLSEEVEDKPNDLKTYSEHDIIELDTEGVKTNNQKDETLKKGEETLKAQTHQDMFDEVEKSMTLLFAEDNEEKIQETDHPVQDAVPSKIEEKCVTLDTTDSIVAGQVGMLRRPRQLFNHMNDEENFMNFTLMQNKIEQINDVAKQKKQENTIESSRNKPKAEKKTSEPKKPKTKTATLKKSSSRSDKKIEKTETSTKTLSRSRRFDAFYDRVIEKMKKEKQSATPKEPYKFSAQYSHEDKYTLNFSLYKESVQKKKLAETKVDQKARKKIISDFSIETPEDVEEHIQENQDEEDKEMETLVNNFGQLFRRIALGTLKTPSPFIRKCLLGVADQLLNVKC